MKDLFKLAVLHEIILVLCFLILAVSSLKTAFVDKTGVLVRDTVYVKVDTSLNPFSAVLVYECIMAAGINHPEIVYKQACLESGYFKSDLFIKCNNLFGMKHPEIRPTLSIASFNGFAVFNNWVDAIMDYKLWQLWHSCDSLNFKDYCKKLKSVYAEDPSYITKLEQIRRAR